MGTCESHVNYQLEFTCPRNARIKFKGKEGERRCLWNKNTLLVNVRDAYEHIKTVRNEEEPKENRCGYLPHKVRTSKHSRFLHSSDFKKEIKHVGKTISQRN